MSVFLVSVGIGLSTAAILALSAVAFTLEYAVSRVANFAHGEFLTIGAYAAYSGQTFFHQNVAAAALIAAAAGMLAALALNIALIEQFSGRSGITVFIATLGASLILQNLLVIVYGAANVSYTFTQGGLHHVGPFLWTTSDIEVIFSALAVAGLIYLLLQRTRFGKAVRAVSQDRTLAQVSGPSLASRDSCSRTRSGPSARRWASASCCSPSRQRSREASAGPMPPSGAPWWSGSSCR